MACALLEPLGESGESIQAADPTTEVDDVPRTSGPGSARSKRSDASKTTGGRPRSKKGAVVTLSSSYTCWRKVPESWLHSRPQVFANSTESHCYSHSYSSRLGYWMNNKELTNY